MPQGDEKKEESWMVLYNRMMMFLLKYFLAFLVKYKAISKEIYVMLKSDFVIQIKEWKKNFSFWPGKNGKSRLWESH